MKEKKRSLSELLSYGLMSASFLLILMYFYQVLFMETY